MSEFRLVTAESVIEGHPDKLADRISDAILDAAITNDPLARVAAEVLVTKGKVFVAGEHLTARELDVEGVVRRAIQEVGYTAESGFDPQNVEVIVAMHGQCEEIKATMQPEDQPGVQGNPLDARPAGDQGVVIGFASDETRGLMPLPILLAHRLARRLAEVRKSGVLPWLRPDGKTQVTLRYDGDQAIGIDSILVSAQHDPGVELDELRRALIEQVILPCLPEGLDHEGARLLVNPAGSFVTAGPGVDSGLTGRKLAVDAYGPQAPVGGAFSGKDSTKVDRTGAYYARYVTRHLVLEGLARRVLLEVWYAIGLTRPVSLRVDSSQTGKMPDERLSRLVGEWLRLPPARHHRGAPA